MHYSITNCYAFVFWYTKSRRIWIQRAVDNKQPGRRGSIAPSIIICICPVERNRKSIESNHNRIFRRLNYEMHFRYFTWWRRENDSDQTRPEPVINIKRIYSEFCIRKLQTNLKLKKKKMLNVYLNDFQADILTGLFQWVARTTNGRYQ